MKKSAFILFYSAMGLAALAAVASFTGLMQGFTGITLLLFFAYCGIIVLAQLISAMFAARRMVDGFFDEYYRRKTPSKQINLR